MQTHTRVLVASGIAVAIAASMGGAAVGIATLPKKKADGSAQTTTDQVHAALKGAGIGLGVSAGIGAAVYGGHAIYQRIRSHRVNQVLATAMAENPTKLFEARTDVMMDQDPKFATLNSSDQHAIRVGVSQALWDRENQYRMLHHIPYGKPIPANYYADKGLKPWSRGTTAEVLHDMQYHLEPDVTATAARGAL